MQIHGFVGRATRRSRRPPARQREGTMPKKKRITTNEVNHVSLYPKLRDRRVRIVEQTDFPEELRFVAWSVADDSIIGASWSRAKLKRDCRESGWDG
jgi:hypothetical protein